MSVSWFGKAFMKQVLAIATAMLAGCIAVPDYSRNTEVYRFQAIRLATIPERGVVFLVQQCGDRPDLRQVCSLHGNNAQYLVLRNANWDVSEGFVKGDRDLKLGAAEYVRFIEPTVREAGFTQFQIGDLISNRKLWQDKTAALRVWHVVSGNSDFQTESNPNPLLEGVVHDIDIQFMRPIVRCESTTMEYRIDTMVLPLPQTMTSHEGPKKSSWHCAPL